MERARSISRPSGVRTLHCTRIARARTTALAAATLTGLTLALAACAAAPTRTYAPAPAHATNVAHQTGHQAPPAPSGETIPAGSTAVTLALHPDMNVHVKPPSPVTVTDPAEVSKLAALINGLPAFPAGAYSCPPDGGAALVLTFSGGKGGRSLAVATVSLEGCEGVGLVTGGKQQPGLGAPDGGRQVAAQAMKVAGLSWDLLDPA